MVAPEKGDSVFFRCTESSDKRHSHLTAAAAVHANIAHLWEYRSRGQVLGVKQG